mgnify:CR=1 FL=1
MIKVKALGVTATEDGKVCLALLENEEDLPADCVVLFISKEVWAEIKKEIVVEG